MSETSGSDVCRLRIEFENNEIDWEHPLDLNGRIIKAMYVNDERIRECYACSKRAELIAENNALLVKVVDLTEERDGLQAKVDELTAYVSQAVEDTAERVTNQGEMLHDTREKLEADVLGYWHEEFPGADKYDMLELVCGWLNRQAAITERELIENARSDCDICGNDFRRQRDEMQAERDQWCEAAGNAHEMWEQADNERIKLAEQLEASRSALEILTLDKAKLQTKVDELHANNANLHELASTQADEIDELQAKVDKLEGGSND